MVTEEHLFLKYHSTIMPGEISINIFTFDAEFYFALKVIIIFGNNYNE